MGGGEESVGEEGIFKAKIDMIYKWRNWIEKINNLLNPFRDGLIKVGKN